MNETQIAAAVKQGKILLVGQFSGAEIKERSGKKKDGTQYHVRQETVSIYANGRPWQFSRWLPDTVDIDAARKSYPAFGSPCALDLSFQPTTDVGVVKLDFALVVSKAA